MSMKPNLASTAFTFFLGLLMTSASADETIDFNQQIRPILSNACFACHGPDSLNRKADLRLDDEASAHQVITPNRHQNSDLFLRISSGDPELLMPPPDSGKILTDAQINLIAKWIDLGAQYETHWSYQKTKQEKPSQHFGNWSKDPIDDYLRTRHKNDSLKPAMEADRRTLIRRLTLDLTGLPPTLEEIDRFVNDEHPTAYRKLVDRLLASPAYGERMAIQWLDLVRYADTVGYHGDQDHNISPYRDYVIDSLVQDRPINQFSTQQIAGDLLPNASIDDEIASGYNRLLQTSHEGGVQVDEYLSIYAADRIRNFSNVWMGATIGCAQCHDHKYDPYTIKDFYSLVAFFADIDEEDHFAVGSDSLPTKRPPEISVLAPWQQARVDQLNAEIAKIESNDEERGIENKLTEKHLSLTAERQRLLNQKRLTMVTKTKSARSIRILPRGDWLDKSGPLVMPEVPEFLPQIQSDRDRANRLDLANWLFDRDDGIGQLTARVFANRYWQMMYGQGISPSLADFGGQGEPPNHPDLLDHLANFLNETQWSTKSFLRRLALTRSYRQSSHIETGTVSSDPRNLLFARQSRYRLPAELVRDAALSISQLISHELGGKSVKPHQPTGYYRHLNFPKRVYVPDRGSDQYRRGLYVHWQRQFLHPMLKAMDAPSREECVALRSVSNTPLEALVMLNDASMVEAAAALASRIIREYLDDDKQRIQFAFELATARRADSKEVTILEELLHDQRDHYAKHADEAATLVAAIQGDSVSNQKQIAEIASWTGVARAILNLHETVTRN